MSKVRHLGSTIGRNATSRLFSTNSPFSFPFDTTTTTNLTNTFKKRAATISDTLTEKSNAGIEASIQQAVKTLDLAVTEAKKLGNNSTATVTINIGILQVSFTQRTTD